MPPQVVVKLERGRDAVYMTVTAQTVVRSPDGRVLFRGNRYIADDEWPMAIKSESNPELDGDSVFIRGHSTGQDSIRVFQPCVRPVVYINKVAALIRAFGGEVSIYEA